MSVCKHGIDPAAQNCNQCNPPPFYSNTFLRYSKVDADKVLMWLGQYRDHLPPEAVKRLQDILDDTP